MVHFACFTGFHDEAGLHPQALADEVVVNFEGRLEGVKAEAGEKPDDLRRRSLVASTFEEGQPKFFPVKDLVPGWAEVIKLMHKGDHWMVRMPASLLYGAEGDGRGAGLHGRHGLGVGHKPFRNGPSSGH